MALLRTLSHDKKMMLCQQGLVTAMVGGVVHTTGASASGVNASNSTAVGGGQDHHDQDGHCDKRPHTVVFLYFRL
jgi:hypothetical protein